MITLSSSLSLSLVSHALIRDIGSVDESICAWREVVGLTGVIVVRCFVDWEALLLQLMADKRGTLEVG